MERFIALIILSFLFGCQSSSNKKNDATTKESFAKMPELKGTQWEFKIADDCINYFQFKTDSNSIYYSCESEDKYYGKYYVENDTLYIHNFVTDTDSLLSPMENEHRSQQAKYKLVIKSGKLKHLERWSYSEVKDSWTKDNFDFGEDFLFEQVK
jgi:hypothetical protein